LTTRKILVIRHAEKPDDAGRDPGVNTEGLPDGNSLTVRGWQRAGALVRFFAPHRGAFSDPRLATPERLFAPRATAQFPSLRSAQTVAPLADFLGLGVNCDFARREEPALAQAILAAGGVSLIAWSHNTLPALATLLAPEILPIPPSWPEDRFDVVWLFDHEDGRWTFHQIPQLLLAGDQEQPIPVTRAEG
jgi:hypothetical protein